jgi:2-amino-4-hydroxy-6-hydroxymethyldihydropteridine diphosphokinase / dihydropteroate synthase
MASFARRIPYKNLKIQELGKSQYRLISRSFSAKAKRSQPQTCYIAFGSNIGDRISNIESACNLIDSLGPATRITRTSGLWETEPMYVEDQDPFLNGVCEIMTDLEPVELLDSLQGIERELKRVKVVDKGPRTIDLDILLYGEERYEDERLTIPHPLMHERGFVLEPLCE